jgi:DNA-binding response OmpR family regulator
VPSRRSARLAAFGDDPAGFLPACDGSAWGSRGVSKGRVLIAEDEDNIREILRMQLELEGYEVMQTCDGLEAVETAEREHPDVILLDVMMPRMDGYEACRLLRQSLATRHVPVIMLTAKKEHADKMAGLSGGANDYVVKPWELPELLQRIHNVLQWSRLQRAASPLTGLPGNLSINEEIGLRLASGVPFGLLQIDIDSFKSYNDHYGYARGDQAIQTLSRILVETARRHGTDAFVGHIGGDDFVVLAAAGQAEQVGQEIIARFDQAVPWLYDLDDRERGYVEVMNRRHVVERFPLMSLTIALVNTERAQVTHLAQLTDIAQELKAHGKGIPGSVLVGERRRQPDPAAEPERDAA